MAAPLSSRSSGFTSITPDFLSAVWGYFALAIGICAIGVWAAPFFFGAVGYSSGIMWAVWIAEMALIFTAHRWSESETWKVPLFMIFAFLLGISTAPLVAYAMAVGHGDYIFKALISSGSMFAAAALWGYSTKKDLSGMGGFLILALIGLIIVSILQIFWFSSMVQLVASGAGVVLFSAFAAYDIQNIKKGMYPNPLYAAIHLFLDMILLFRQLLMFMLSMASNE